MQIDPDDLNVWRATASSLLAQSQVEASPTAMRVDDSPILPLSDLARRLMARELATDMLDSRATAPRVENVEVMRDQLACSAAVVLAYRNGVGAGRADSVEAARASRCVSTIIESMHDSILTCLRSGISDTQIAHLSISPSTRRALMYLLDDADIPHDTTERICLLLEPTCRISGEASEIYKEVITSKRDARFQDPAMYTNHVISAWAAYLNAQLRQNAPSVLLWDSAAMYRMASDVAGKYKPTIRPPGSVSTYALPPGTQVLCVAFHVDPDHWTFGCFCLAEKRAFCFDSLKSSDDQKPSKAQRALLDGVIAGIAPKTSAEWGMTCPPYPQQDNGHDCGVFVCRGLERLVEVFSRTPPTPASTPSALIPTTASAWGFGQDDMAGVRTQLEETLLHWVRLWY